MDTNVLTKKKEKVDKYLSLTIELQRLWNTTVEVVPIVFGALGSLSDNIVTNLSLLQINDITPNQLQKTVLLKTATIFWLSQVLVELENCIFVLLIVFPFYGDNMK